MNLTDFSFVSRDEQRVWRPFSWRKIVQSKVCIGAKCSVKDKAKNHGSNRNKKTKFDNLAWASLERGQARSQVELFFVLNETHFCFSETPFFCSNKIHFHSIEISINQFFEHLHGSLWPTLTRNEIHLIMIFDYIHCHKIGQHLTTFVLPT